jgi:uncharacterized protein involved in high-affinity Fe2+ transport
MKVKNLIVLLLIAVCSTAAFASGTVEEWDKFGNPIDPDITHGTKPRPWYLTLGDDLELGPLNVAGVYFQPMDMVPASAGGLPASQSDMHMLANISALENDLGYGVGDFVPNLTVEYEIAKSTGEKTNGTFIPMNVSDGANVSDGTNVSDGPHYGANVKLPGGGPGTYTVRFMIQNPEAPGYVLHVDQETGVPGRFGGTPLVAEWTVNYAGPSW